MIPTALLVAALQVEPPTPPPSEPPRPPIVAETMVAAGTGITYGPVVSGLALSILFTHGIDVLDLGIEGNATILTSGLFGVGPVAGIHLGEEFSFRLLGTVGLHYYSSAGHDFLTGDPGISGTLPYIGARWLFGYRVHVSNVRQRPFIGLLAAADVDLMHRKETVAYTDGYGDFGTPQEQRATHEIGQISFSGMLMGGWELDLAPY
jgi:hypothetical protein